MKDWQDERDDFEIEGGRKLSGQITTNASKNGATHLFAAALVNRGKTTFKNIILSNSAMPIGTEV